MAAATTASSNGFSMQPSSGPATPLPSPQDLEGTWAFLKDGIEVMMERCTEGMSYKRYMELYTVAYNRCARQGASSGGAIGTDGSNGSRAGMGANVMGADLYDHLSSYFQMHLKTVRAGSESLNDEALLKYYAAEWDRYTAGANFVHRLFAYLNRHYVKREKEEGRRKHFVYTLALVQWKEYFFRAVKDKQRLASALLKQIEKQRNGDVIETSLVKKVIDSMVSLGLDEQDSTRLNLDVYRAEFEKYFLSATELYYKAESDAFVAVNSVVDYMKKAESRLKEEEDRIELYLHADTRLSLIRTCENALVRDHRQLMWDEFQALLDSEKADDLYRMYTLLSRTPDGLDPLREKFEAHVKRAGLAAVEKVAGEKGESMDPAAYISALLGVHARSLATVTQSFRGEAGFLASLDKACRNFMNRNKATGTNTSKSPELLAKHADGLLRKSNKMAEESSLEEALNQIMIVFKYIEDRDVFQKFYAKLLARRLVNDTSASDDAEASMISKLKEASGFEYTNKLQRMFTDVSVCKEFNDHFKAAQELNEEPSEFDFYVMILTSGMWPLQAPTSEFIIPPELLNTYKRLERHYQNKHSGRKLMWLWQHSKNELKTNHLSQKLIFQTTTYQTAILLQFNTADTLSYSDLAKGTGLNDATLKPILGLLTKAKVLLQEGTSAAAAEGENGGASGGGNESYSLNMNFKSKKLRVNLNLPTKSEQKAESTAVLKTVDEDRKILLQATIVRIMKARKQLKHAQLIQETILQVQSRFQPKVSDIKDAIGNLLEKDYIERVEGQKDLYQYVA